MLVHSVLPRSAVNGPGERVVIWFQGCDLRCPGCWNPSSHAFDRARDKPWDRAIRRFAGNPGRPFPRKLSDRLQMSRYGCNRRIQNPQLPKPGTIHVSFAHHQRIIRQSV